MDPVTDLRALLYDGDALAPAKIELEESSGAVFPRHQFTTRVVVEARGAEVTLRYDDVGEYVDGVPARDLHLDVTLPSERYLELWRELLEGDVFSLHRDFIGDQRGRQGVACNRFEVTLRGEVRARFDYLLSQVHSFAFFRYRAALHAVKSLKHPG